MVKSSKHFLFDTFFILHKKSVVIVVS